MISCRAQYRRRTPEAENFTRVMETSFYWLPECTTCQKAKRRLDYHRVAPTNFRDIKREPLDRSEIERLAALIGGAENLFSRRSVKYRELGLKDKTLSDDEMVDLMTNEYTFLKRPILVIGDRAIAGFFEKEYDALLRSR
ncbi:MAG: Arsenate reductase glutaredoxin-coupled [uncultured Pyrinomonadaceae bacterium]|uniref:Arsenate reductase glutaredoxin-coupled n=1 Tax=uncultured Pyrinomonadaceae bacterium TaxID=2283094 RepID=A0A6J4NFE3_9BACT|nr:MAG: Arsenate reductase glutaredoxin-coupled [uncultured Pyrinomonadaceae bacterium]